MRIDNPLNVFDTGVQGLQASQRQAESAASSIARDSAKIPDSEQQAGSGTQINQSLVDLARSERNSDANVRTIEAGAKTVGTIIDIKA
jgi:L-amino acid N-acyltransferase YncA|tara:strand:- start:2033 stop:2296 length:264 start_codon:yes stop_codon:yes gene_type:complete